MSAAKAASAPTSGRRIQKIARLRPLSFLTIQPVSALPSTSRGVCLVERGQFVRSAEPSPSPADHAMASDDRLPSNVGARARRLSSPQGSSSADCARLAD